MKRRKEKENEQEKGECILSLAIVSLFFFILTINYDCNGCHFHITRVYALYGSSLYVATTNVME